MLCVGMYTYFPFYFEFICNACEKIRGVCGATMSKSAMFAEACFMVACSIKCLLKLSECTKSVRIGGKIILTVLIFNIVYFAEAEVR